MADNSSDEYVHGKPSEGMCCACTYEDITEEDQNYGKCIIFICNCNATQCWIIIVAYLIHLLMYYYSWVSIISINEMEAGSVWVMCCSAGKKLYFFIS